MATSPDGPSCCVVVPAYNTAAYVAETIESVLAQTFRPFEVVVVDDGSTDATPATLASFGDAITVVRQVNSGPGRARNVGVRTGTGEVIAFVDSDDVWEPERLARCVDALVRDDTVAVVTTDAFVIEDSERTARRYYERDAAAGRPFPGPGQQLAEIMEHNFVFSSAVLWRSAFDAVGGFDEDRDLMGSEDYDLWLRVLATGRRIGLIAEPLAGYRVRPGSFTSDVGRQWQTHLAVLERNLPSLWGRGIRARAGVYFEIAQGCARAGKRREALRFVSMGAQARDLPLRRRARAVGGAVRDLVTGARGRG